MANCKYNDYTLPEKPAEWDQTTHPHAVIIHGIGTVYFLLICSDTPFVAKTVDGVQAVAFSSEANCYYFPFARPDTAWGAGGVFEASDYVEESSERYYFKPDVAEWVWCNTDICDDAGTVVFSASEPVPIEEESTKKWPGLKSWLIGLAANLSAKPRPHGGEAGAGGLSV